MTSVKEKMAAVINAQPDDATYDDILRELAFERMVARGLVDARQERGLSEAEMARRIEEWQKESGPTRRSGNGR